MSCFIPQGIFLTDYEIYVSQGWLNDHNTTPAARIYHTWQLQYHKTWKWNNSHRHLSENAVVPISDNTTFHRQGREFLREQLRCKKTRRDLLFGILDPFISPSFTPEERQSCYIIRNVLKRLRDKNRRQQQIKRHWWNHNTYGSCIDIMKDLDEYKEMVTKPIRYWWISIAVELGFTYRHYRVSGFVNYVHEAEELEDEFETIRNVVLEIAHQRGYIDRYGLPPDDFLILTVAM